MQGVGVGGLLPIRLTMDWIMFYFGKSVTGSPNKMLMLQSSYRGTLSELVPQCKAGESSFLSTIYYFPDSNCICLFSLPDLIVTLGGEGFLLGKQYLWKSSSIFISHNNDLIRVANLLETSHNYIWSLGDRDHFIWIKWLLWKVSSMVL